MHAFSRGALSRANVIKTPCLGYIAIKTMSADGNMYSM